MYVMHVFLFVCLYGALGKGCLPSPIVHLLPRWLPDTQAIAYNNDLSLQMSYMALCGKPIVVASTELPMWLKLVNFVSKTIYIFSLL